MSPVSKYKVSACVAAALLGLLSGTVSAGNFDPGGLCIRPLLSDFPLPAATRYEQLNAIEQGTFALADLVRLGHNPQNIAAFISHQDLNLQAGFGAALIAFSGIPAGQMQDFASSHAGVLQKFSLAVQAHQDWYESLTTRLAEKIKGKVTVLRSRPRVTFSRSQLTAMRQAFRGQEGLLTNGALLLAYPDRIERNEAVTAQYKMLSDSMRALVGSDDGSWSTVAVWASDYIGRNVSGNDLMYAAEALGSNPRYWLSVGNSQLVSDIGVAFGDFTLTFANGANRGLDFEDWWTAFTNAYRGRNISYIDGSGDLNQRMKTGFSAYYQAMLLQDQAQATSDPDQQASLDVRRRQLLLFANTFVAMQEQWIVQPVLDNGMCMLGMVDPGGADAGGVDYIVPGSDGNGEQVIHTDRDLADTAIRIGLDQDFTLLDGSTVAMGSDMQSTLNGLPGVIPGVDEYDPANSGTRHWEEYGQRMGFIFQLFSDYQAYTPLFEDPREVFGTRAWPLNNHPTLALYKKQH